jgi:hypothetical protein
MFESTREVLIAQIKQAALTGSAYASYVAAGAVFVCAIVVAVMLPRRYRTSGIIGDQVDVIEAEKADGTAESTPVTTDETAGAVHDGTDR